MIALAIGVSAAQIPIAAAAAAAPSPASRTPPPTEPQPVGTLDLETGGFHDTLNAGRPAWEQTYLQAFYASTAGLKAYATAESGTRFGFHDNAYGFGLYVPTKYPHGVFGADYSYSPQHNVLPASAWTADYDLRAGGGHGYQFTYSGRRYTGVNASIWSVGTDRYIGDQRLAYVATVARLSNVSGTAFSQGVQWSTFMPMDTIRVSANVGRDVENTRANQPAAYGALGIDVDELHWFDSKTAIHVNVEYSALSGAYDRLQALFGLHIRF